jgi:hypothetical protein
MARGAKNRHPRKRSKPESAADAFFTLPFEEMLAKLDRPASGVLSDSQAAALGHVVDAALTAQQAGLPLVLGVASESSSLQPPRRNVMDVRVRYYAVRDRYRRVVHTWKAGLPRRRKKAEMVEARAGAGARLKRMLRAEFPDMPNAYLEAFASSEVESDPKGRVLALRGYVGSQLRPAVAAATIRDAIRNAGHALLRWQSFLDWITRKGERKELAGASIPVQNEMAALALVLEWWRGEIAGPLPANYYEDWGPLWLAATRMGAAIAPHPDPKLDWLKPIGETFLKLLVRCPDWLASRRPTD